MELHAVDRKLPMAKSHDLALRRSRIDFQAIRNARGLQQKRVISRGIEWIRQSAKNPGAIVMHRGRFAVHQALGPHHLSAKNFADALVPEADSEQRPARSQALDQLRADSRVLWTARPG